MSKFVWYIVDLEEGSIEGTNDVEQVGRLLTPEFEDRFIALYGQRGEYYRGSNTPILVQEIEDPEAGLDDGEEAE